MKRFGSLLLLLTLPALYAGRYACILELRAGSPELAAENRVPVAGIMPREDLIARAEALGQTVVTAFPDSDAAARYRALSRVMLDLSDEA